MSQVERSPPAAPRRAGLLLQTVSSLFGLAFSRGNRFHLVHVFPRSELHTLQGYTEVVDTVRWGLKKLGHNVTSAMNTFDVTRINIVFGAQRLTPNALEYVPQSTIAYNFEQVSGLDLMHSPIGQAIAKHCHIWEYSQANLAKWAELKPRHPVLHVPVGWSPILRCIDKPKVQDIDVLIYGIPGDLRLKVFQGLCDRGVRCVFVCGLYGKARDALIARSKLVLNLNATDNNPIFEIVRVSYLLANGKAVVADMRPGRYVDAELHQAVAFFPESELVEGCISLLKNDAARLQLEQKGRETVERRPIVPILQQALAQANLARPG